jgi:ParB-like chromosome segregation protein Spo0J
MKALQIEYRDVAKLLPYIKNSRVHSTLQVTQISKSIKQFGFTNPILIDDEGGLIAGHGRLQAAKLLKMKQVPCIVLGYLTDAERRAYVILDNKIALGSEWDMEVLQSEVESLQLEGFDLEGLGIDFEFADAQDMDADVDDAELEPQAPKNEYPVYISLSRKDYERWKVIRGKDNDTQAFLRITNALD